MLARMVSGDSCHSTSSSPLSNRSGVPDTSLPTRCWGDDGSPEFPKQVTSIIDLDQFFPKKYLEEKVPSQRVAAAPIPFVSAQHEPV